MNYEQMIRETDDIVRRVMWHNDMVTWLLGGMLAGLMIVLGWIAWSEHREKMKILRSAQDAAREADLTRAQREWEDMQAAQNEPYYRRM